ncbi:anaphase-promoting complex subunit 11 [Sipha flava]|uniref:Anaphase-promoting complex subunit 11 n=1 Tax=Sipha flava TaxID=143950 RepID=A0A8B8G4G1_9HEMI|nr:anaphase-promoting complex subunit 11 [Sipha flava]
MSDQPESFMRIVIKEFLGVGNWRWSFTNDRICGICRVQFEICCPNCDNPEAQCPIAWGRCSHAFHLHCVLKWLDTEHANNKCPICRQNWELRVY